jgi:proline racemase
VFEGVCGAAVSVVDAHTEGMAIRVVVDGVDELPGRSMSERRQYFLDEWNDLRTFLMCEPRGHEAMTGALLQRPSRPDADVGVVWMEVQGSIAACGHGAMGVAVVLVATGRVPAVEPETVVRLDTPSGLVVARVQVRDGRIGPVTLEMIPAHSVGLDREVLVPGFGTVRYDLAYGGNHCVITELADLGLPFDRSKAKELMAAGLAVVDAVAAQESLRHPDGSPSVLRHAQLLAPGADADHSRHAMVIAPGWFDRSPCGTGTSARMAQLHARGELALGDPFVNESLIGSRFTGRLTAERDGTVLPEITGRAFVTGTSTFTVDPDDPFGAGFLIQSMPSN